MIKKLASLKLFFVISFLMMGAMTVGTLLPQNPNFSSFQITKDPGTPIVYAGFLLLPFGLFLSFYGGKK